MDKKSLWGRELDFTLETTQQLIKGSIDFNPATQFFVEQRGGGKKKNYKIEPFPCSLSINSFLNC